MAGVDGVAGEGGELVPEGGVADHDVEDPLGGLAGGVAGGGASGHLDEGVGAALLGGAGQVGGLGVVAEAGAGFGPVRFEHLLFEAAELGEELGAADGVEPGVDADHPVEGPRGVGAAAFVGLAGAFFGAVGVHEVHPRPHRPTEQVEVQGAGRGDELGFGLREELFGVGVDGPAQGGDVFEGDPPVAVGVLGQWHRAGLAGHADLVADPPAVGLGLGRHPRRRRRLGVEAVLPRRVERGERTELGRADHALDARELHQIVAETGLGPVRPRDTGHRHGGSFEPVQLGDSREPRGNEVVEDNRQALPLPPHTSARRAADTDDSDWLWGSDSRPAQQGCDLVTLTLDEHTFDTEEKKEGAGRPHREARGCARKS